MQSILRISDAAAIALHTADYLVKRTRGGGGVKVLPSTAADIAKALDVSYNHLSKVLQQLTRAGFIVTERGPKGGFLLSAAGEKARIKDFIAAVDAPRSARTCLMKHKVCGHRDCVFGDFLSETNKRFETVLNTKISKLGKG